jgi:hypothetical protein
MPIHGKGLLHMAYLLYENYARLFEVISKRTKQKNHYQLLQERGSSENKGKWGSFDS